MPSKLYAPPRERLRLTTNDAEVLRLADRLWEPAQQAGDDAPPLAFEVTVSAGPPPGEFAERALAWTLGERVYEVSIPGLLSARIELASCRVTAQASSGLLERDPGLFVRHLLEAPAAVFLERRAFRVLHAGAVAGPRGAVVLRGASGAGKSTLVAAAFLAGFSVLGDESLLVAREDPDEIASSVRDLTLQSSAAELLGVAGEPAWAGREEKVRLDLFAGSSPGARRARRVATFLLGPREPPPARLVALAPWELREEFRLGEVPQEWTAGDPERIASEWSTGAHRLEGASDLAGALRILAEYTGAPSVGRSPSLAGAPGRGYDPGGS